MQKESVKKIIDTIKMQHVTPHSIVKIRWKSYLFWMVWGCIMVIGAISFSLMILNVLDVHPEFFRHMGTGRYVRVLFMTAPYLWIMLALVAAASGFVAMRKTHRGYRYNMLFISSISVLIIMLLGTIVHISKINDRIGEGMTRGGVPRGMVFPSEGRLGRPDHGIIGGRVADVLSDHLVIEHPSGDQWTILYDEKTQIDLPHEIVDGTMIEVVGEQTDEYNFYAKFIRPLPKRMPRSFEVDQNMKRDFRDKRYKRRDVTTSEKIVPLSPQNDVMRSIE